MARDAKRRQKKLQKKSAKRRQRRADMTRRSVATAAPSLSRTKDWPLEAIWISENWPLPEELTQILIMRRGPHGHVAIGLVLVDRMCLGVKNAYGRVTNDFEYNEVLNSIRESQGATPAHPNLVAKIIRESVAYASELGLRPNKDLKQALFVLGDADADACHDEIEMGGPDGKPHFIAGPYDNVDKITKTLTQKLGPDGFTYMIPVSPQGGTMSFNGVGVTRLKDDDDGAIVLDEDDFEVVT